MGNQDASNSKNQGGRRERKLRAWPPVVFSSGRPTHCFLGSFPNGVPAARPCRSHCLPPGGVNPTGARTASFRVNNSVSFAGFEMSPWALTPFLSPQSHTKARGEDRSRRQPAASGQATEGNLIYGPSVLWRLGGVLSEKEHAGERRSMLV